VAGNVLATAKTVFDVTDAGRVMLPENILEELTRPSPLRRDMVRLAWPSLSTTERLQVLSRIDASDWLVALAMEDEHPIVRHWGAREYHGPSRTTVRDGKFVYLPTEEVPLDTLGRKIASDESELVRLLVDERPYLEATQLSRLVRIRGHRPTILQFFIGWLDSALKMGISDAELADCAHEYFNRPDAKRDLARINREESDGPFDHYSAGETLSSLWQVFGRAGPRLRTVLLYRLPFAYRGHEVSSGDVINLPNDALIDVIRVHGEQPSVAKISQQVIEHSELYSEDLVKAVRELAARQDRTWPLVPMETEKSLQNELLSELQSMRQQVAELREELAKFRALGRRKWFS